MTCRRRHGGGISWRATALAVLLIGCSEDAPKLENATYLDQGKLCVSGEGNGVSVEVTFRSCIDSCDQTTSRCEVSTAGDRLVVTSRLDVRTSIGDGRNCTGECAEASATCSLSDLAPGTYTVEHGSDTAQVTLPAVAPLPLFYTVPECESDEVVDPHPCLCTARD